jgi:methionyl-tRNA formyltransferase
MPSPEPKVVVFGDDVGMPRMLRLLPAGCVRGAVRAAIRPAQREPLESLCAAARVPLLVHPRRTSSEHSTFVRKIERLTPDLILVDSYSMLLSPELLAIPRRGAFNVHGALLPAYRGANPTQWALLNDERETGVTIHVMTEEFDAGDIVAERRVPIRFADTWLDIHARIRDATESLLAERLPGILAGAYERHSQDPDAAQHFRRRRAEDGEIDWDASVLAMYNLIRALVAPNPGAFYRTGGTQVVLDRYQTISEVAALKYARPGAQPLAGERVQLVPLPDGGNETVTLAVSHNDGGASAGRALLTGIDWDRRTARLVIEADKSLEDEAGRLARLFALDQLELENVIDPGAASG